MATTAAPVAPGGAAPGAPAGVAAGSAQALCAIAALEPEYALERMGSHAEGLTAHEVQERLERFGPNVVARQEAPGALRQILRHLRNPLNVLLLVLASVSVATDNVESAVIISAMVVLSVSLAFFQERRSDRAAAQLRAMVQTTAAVIRRADAVAGAGAADEGATLPAPREVAIAGLVPGDVIHLSAGDLVPADARLLRAKDLFLNQAALTGESLPAEKFAHAEVAVKAALELSNICFQGTSVASGTGIAVVVHTGARAVFGEVARLVEGEPGETGFDRGITRFTWLMIRFILVMVPLVFLVNGLTKGNWLEALLFAVAVAVGLTPEMLPMLVTVNLSRGAIAMSRRKVIVKHLKAIQNFGAMDVLCTDKTGTLTQDRILLERYVNLDGEEDDRVLEFAYLNSFYQSGLRNLLDDAVLKYTEVHRKVHEAGDFRKVDEIPFDFLRRRMSVIVERAGERLLICKGAVEEVFRACGEGESAGRRFALDESHLAALQAQARALNEDGFRVIAIAYKRVDPRCAEFSAQEETQLVLVGYVAFLDPPKDSARGAIGALAAHGIAVKVLTGDNEIVTRKVCRDVGLPVERIVLGSELEGLDAARLEELATSAQVFCKLSPPQKAAMICALQRRGHTVGFLGDGINDAPALRAADVGISVDTAVDIARESAEIILLEKSLLVLDEGVIEGRRVFANILKYIRMGASSNFGNMFSVLGASAWLPFLPMAPIQVLTNNLLYDFSQTAIPTDNVDREFLERPRRWEIDSIARFMLFLGPVSSVFDYATFAAMFYVFGAQDAGHAALFQTGWFVESLLSQTLIIHIIRTSRIPFLESHASATLIATSVAICLVGIWLPVSPLAHALGFVPLPWTYWPFIAALLLAYMVLAHLVKSRLVRHYGTL